MSNYAKLLNLAQEKKSETGQEVQICKDRVLNTQEDLNKYGSISALSSLIIAQVELLTALQSHELSCSLYSSLVSISNEFEV